jgi:hypothetical protein
MLPPQPEYTWTIIPKPGPLGNRADRSDRAIYLLTSRRRLFR